MGFKARELEGQTKAQLIKALGTAQKRITKLEREVNDLKSGARLDALRIDKALQADEPPLVAAARKQAARHAGKPHPYGIPERAQRVVDELDDHDQPGISEELETRAIVDAAAAELDRRAKLPGIGPCKPYDASLPDTPSRFPWEPK